MTARANTPPSAGGAELVEVDVDWPASMLPPAGSPLTPPRAYTLGAEVYFEGILVIDAATDWITFQLPMEIRPAIPDEDGANIMWTGLLYGDAPIKRQVAAVQIWIWPTAWASGPPYDNSPWLGFWVHADPVPLLEVGSRLDLAGINYLRQMP